jgi:uncharacterized protein YpiB (UPF0302 family)
MSGVVILKNNKSYSDLVKDCYMKKQKRESSLQEMFIDMIIHEALLNSKKDDLERKLDDALDKKDKILFMKLSSEMKKLLLSFGT